MKFFKLWEKRKKEKNQTQRNPSYITFILFFAAIAYTQVIADTVPEESQEPACFVLVASRACAEEEDYIASVVGAAAVTWPAEPEPVATKPLYWEANSRATIPMGQEAHAVEVAAYAVFGKLCLMVAAVVVAAEHMHTDSLVA